MTLTPILKERTGEASGHSEAMPLIASDVLTS